MAINDYKYTYAFFNLFGKPTDINDKINAVKQYVSYMLCRTQQIFEYDGLPDTIPQRMLELMLQINGNVCFTKVNGKLYVFNGNFGGEPDEYYMPTIYTVSNPYLKFTANLKVNKDCIVVPNDAMYMGLIPMFNRYATLLSENDISIRIADINLRVTNLVSASDDATKESALDYLNDVEQGKLGIVGESGFLEGIKSNPYNGNNSNAITQLIELQQYLKASWYNDLGLNANYNMKREAINSNESQLNDDALIPFIDDMLNQRKIGLEKVNKMFGTNITVKLNSVWEMKEKEREMAEENEDVIQNNEDSTESNDDQSN